MPVLATMMTVRAATSVRPAAALPASSRNARHAGSDANVCCAVFSAALPCSITYPTLRAKEMLLATS